MDLSLKKDIRKRRDFRSLIPTIPSPVYHSNPYFTRNSCKQISDETYSEFFTERHHGHDIGSGSRSEHLLPDGFYGITGHAISVTSSGSQTEEINTISRVKRESNPHDVKEHLF